MHGETKGRSWTEEHELKDVAWLARLLGVSKSWVYQAVESGRMPCVRIGALVRFDRRVIEAWLKGETVETKRVHLPSCR